MHIYLKFQFNYLLMLFTISSIVLVGLLSNAYCREYYLSPTGRDSNIGSVTQPWRTIEKANKSLMAGDSVFFQPGTYEGMISPANNGTQASPIKFLSIKSLAAVLTGVRNSPTISLINKRHIDIEGFHIHPLYGSWAIIDNSSDISLQNCRLEDNRVAYMAFTVAGCKNIRIMNNVFTKQLSMVNNLALSGNLLYVGKSDRTVVEGNIFSKAGHCPASWLLTTNDVIRRNIFSSIWGRNFELLGCNRILFEENVTVGNYDGSGSADAGSKILTINGIVRRNIAVHNWDFVIHSASYLYGNYPRWILSGTRIYNNTFADNASHAWLLSGDNNKDISDNIWENNIFFNHDYSGSTRTFYISGKIANSNLWLNNLISGNKSGDNSFWLPDKNIGAIVAYNLSNIEKRLPSQFRNNYDFSPAFTDAYSNDYTLSPQSPCIDRGSFLTATLDDGSGKELAVLDSSWFYDGFGIEGEKGDLIEVGRNKQIARIVSIDSTNHILKLDRILSWKKGDVVSPHYVGAAPDMGALEFGAQDQSWAKSMLETAQTIQWQSPGDPKAPLIRTYFEDEDLEYWGYMWHWGRIEDSKAIQRVSQTAATGKYSVKLAVEKDGDRINASIAPRNWEIDRYPLIEFSYRIPNGVPVGLLLAGFSIAPSAQGARSLSIGGSITFVASDKNNIDRYRLIDDDQWHKVAIDTRIIRDQYKDISKLHAFSLISSNNIKSGQFFFFDDFSVLPLQ